MNSDEEFDSSDGVGNDKGDRRWRKRKKLCHDSDLDSDNEDDNYTYTSRGGDSKAIIVVDLDKTLIDGNSVPYPNSSDFIARLKKHYKWIFLWSAGNEAHVQSFLTAFAEAHAFVDVITGCINKCKPINVIRDKCTDLRALAGPSFLVDDNRYNLQASCYDHPINVTEYYVRTACKSKTVVAYQRILNEIENLVRSWYRKHK